MEQDIDSKQKMKQTLKCPLCNESIYSGLGLGCKMCGMISQDKNKEFCSKICRRKYKKIHKLN